MPTHPLHKETFTVTSIKRQGFRDIAAGISATTVTLIADLIWIPRLGTVTPLEFDISYGVSGVVTAGTRMEWWLALVDINNLPGVEGLLTRAIWYAAQFWQFGDATGINQMLSRDLVDFFNPQSYTYGEVADFTQRSAISVIGRQSSNKTTDAVGVITWQEVLIQRVFGGDSATFDDSDAKWVDDFSDEEDEDND